MKLYTEDEVRNSFSAITKKLIEKNLTITTMESCTGGFIASLITDTEGASSVIKGAFVTYSNEGKIMQGVPAETIDEFGVYSPETAAAMAKACKKSYGADIGIGVTGTFGNLDPKNPDSTEGVVYFSIDADEENRVFMRKLPHQNSRFGYKIAIAGEIIKAIEEII